MFPLRSIGSSAGWLGHRDDVAFVINRVVLPDDSAAVRRSGNHDVVRDGRRGQSASGPVVIELESLSTGIAVDRLIERIELDIQPPSSRFGAPNSKNVQMLARIGGAIFHQVVFISQIGAANDSDVSGLEILEPVVLEDNIATADRIDEIKSAGWHRAGAVQGAILNRQSTCCAIGLDISRYGNRREFSGFTDDGVQRLRKCID